MVWVEANAISYEYTPVNSIWVILHIIYHYICQHQTCSSCLVTRSCLTICGLQQARLPCPPLSPRVYSDSCSLSQWCHPTILSSIAPSSTCPQSFPASFFPNELAKDYWSLSLSICPYNEYSGLISFKIDWFDLRGVQGTLKSLLHHHSSKA